MDILELRKSAGEFAQSKVLAVREDQWNTPSNCANWTVKQLVNHLVSDNYREPEILAGKTVKEIGDQFEGDLVGNNPLEVWEKSIREATATIENNPPAIDHMVHLSYADVPGHEYLSQRILDLTVHAWDIAKSTGQNLTVPPDLVQYLWETFSKQDKMIRHSGLYGKAIPTPQDAPLQVRLLGLLGRQ